MEQYWQQNPPSIDFVQQVHDCLHVHAESSTARGRVLFSLIQHHVSQS